MKRLLLVAALLLTGCGGSAATPASSPTPTATPTASDMPLHKTFSYMADFLEALRSHDLACPNYQQATDGLDTNMREAGNCPGMSVVLFNTDMSQPLMVNALKVYAMRYPYTFADGNWLIWTDTAENAKQIEGMIGYQPLTR